MLKLSLTCSGGVEDFVCVLVEGVADSQSSVLADKVFGGAVLSIPATAEELMLM